MCGKKEDEGECSQSLHSLYQEQFFLQQQLQQQHNFQYSDGFLGGGGGRGLSSSSSSGLFFPEVSPIIPWSFPQVQANYNNPVQFSSAHDNNPFLVPQPSATATTSSSPYGGLFNRRNPSPLQFAYEGDHLRIHHGSTPFGVLQPDLGKLTAQEIMDAKALAASKSHSEAERRRRERINNHLAKLRSLLPSTTKTDKASLLAEVIQHVKELKRQTSQIAEASPVPTETDELTVDASPENGKLIIKASLCCEDRSDLLPELIKTLKALRLKTLKAEITTLGGRVKNVLFITSEEDQEDDDDESKNHNNVVNSIQEALKAVMERAAAAGDDSTSGSIKRQRTNMNILEHHHQQQRSL
ncbi:Transcription factor bHLH30 [Ranunculus cassubicifolius]